MSRRTWVVVLALSLGACGGLEPGWEAPEARGKADAKDISVSKEKQVVYYRQKPEGKAWEEDYWVSKSNNPMYGERDQVFDFPLAASKTYHVEVDIQPRQYLKTILIGHGTEKNPVTPISSCDGSEKGQLCAFPEREPADFFKIKPDGVNLVEMDTMQDAHSATLSKAKVLRVVLRWRNPTTMGVSLRVQIDQKK